MFIGKNINEIYGESGATVYTVNGEKIAYCARVCVTCDEKNETFYSKDGKLHFRENNELVEWNRDDY